MDILVGINAGRIEVRQARRDGVLFFETEAEAVAHLCRHVAQMARRVGYAPSCDRPDLNGRSGFSKHTFDAMLQREVARFRGMSGGPIAA